MSTATSGPPSAGQPIGEVSRRTGIPIETLRFYDRSGLLGELPRTRGGHRVFDADALGLLDVVVRLRRTGMPIDDIRAFVRLVRSGRAVGDRIELLSAHRERVRGQLDQLGRDLAVIEWKIAAYTAVEAGHEPPPPPPGWPDPTDPDTTAPTAGPRRLGRAGPEVSALGVGTWALGGPFRYDGRDAGWGPADDDVSIRTLHAAIDHGATLIDTAAIYGTGHSERIVGRALAELPAEARDRIVVATKFGHVFDEESRSGAGSDVSAAAIRAECEASLRRLGIEAIGLYQLHGGATGAAAAEDVVTVLEDLARQGKIRWFGTSQDAPDIIELFARSPRCVAVQTQVNVFGWSQTVLELARENALAVLARSPLAMGLLSGGYRLDRRPAPGDVRLDTPWWTYFDGDAMESWLTRLESVRELLTTGGRTLVQGALGYLWALDPAIIPLPGVRTPAQAEENVGALRSGALPEAVAAEVTALLADSPERRP